MHVYIQWVFIKHLLCARRHCVPLWVKVHCRVSSGSKESHVHSGKTSTMFLLKAKHGMDSVHDSFHRKHTGSSFSSEWQPLSFCFWITKGMFSTVKSYRGLRNGYWLSSLHTEEDTGCQRKWMLSCTLHLAAKGDACPGSPGAPSPRMPKWAALPLARALGAAPARPDLDIKLGGLVSHFFLHNS